MASFFRGFGGAEVIEYTRDYLLAFEAELAKATESDTFIAAMHTLYSDADLGVAHDIGAKVALSEMKWG